MNSNGSRFTRAYIKINFEYDISPVANPSGSPHRKLDISVNVLGKRDLNRRLCTASMEIMLRQAVMLSATQFSDRRDRYYQDAGARLSTRMTDS